MQTRPVGKDAFLEASVENCTRAPLVLEYVRVDPAQGLTAQQISSNLPQHDQHGVHFEDWMEGLEVEFLFRRFSSDRICPPAFSRYLLFGLYCSEMSLGNSSFQCRIYLHVLTGVLSEFLPMVHAIA